MAELTRYASTYYPTLENGVLLVAGGIADQPARYWDVINLIRSLETKAERKYLEITKETQTADG